MVVRFDAIEPYDSGMLDVGDGRIYWEASGNPDGKPAVALHGGPGSGLSPGRRRSFNPLAYRFVQFDQRGCGRSTPSVANHRTSLDTNTTEHLIGDMINFGPLANSNARPWLSRSPACYSIVVPTLLQMPHPLQQCRHDIAGLSSWSCRRCRWQGGIYDNAGPTLLFATGDSGATLLRSP